MPVRLGVVATTLALLTIAACGSSGSDDGTTAPTTSPPASSAPPTTAPTSFTSTRHGYRVEVPPGWRVTEYEGTWTDLEQFNPGSEVPGEDVVAPLSISSFLVVNSMPIPDGMSAADWLVAFEALVAPAFTSSCPGTTRTGVLAGEPATIVEQPCEGSMIIGRSLTHRGRGYYFTTRGPLDDPDSEATLEDLVASIEFVDD
jgi:hypothetical protein